MCLLKINKDDTLLQSEIGGYDLVCKGVFIILIIIKLGRIQTPKPSGRGAERVIPSGPSLRRAKIIVQISYRHNRVGRKNVYPKSNRILDNLCSFPEPFFISDIVKGGQIFRNNLLIMAE